MNRYIIGSLWDRANRNDINKNFEYLFEGRQKIDELNYRADKILRDAEVVIRNNNNTNERLDRIIADSGTSSTEVVDARGGHEVLSGRLNKYDYLVERPMLNNGKITLPSDFPEVPFNIYRKDKYNYVHDATPYNQFDWSVATEVFITARRNSNYNGESIFQPIDTYTFGQKLSNGDYGSQDSFIFTIVDNIYDSSNGLGVAGVKNLLIRSKSISGKTIVSAFKKIGEKASSWIADSGVYSTTLTDGTTHAIHDVINTVKTDGYGMSSIYTKLDTLTAVQNEKGTFYQSGKKIYCNPHATENISQLTPSTTINLFVPRDEHEIIMFEDIVMPNITPKFDYVNGVNAIYFFRCGFLRGLGQDAFSISGGKYNVYLLDCVSAYATKDGFNYHTTNSDSLAVEVNCVAYGAGLHKRMGNTTTHSNNGSTAHDGMNMLRVGSHYWDCEGPPVADVNDCYSISIGVKVGNILETTTGHRDAFHLSAESGTSLKPKYVIESESYGKNILRGINAPQGNAYYMDFTGNTNIVNAYELEEW